MNQWRDPEGMIREHLDGIRESFHQMNERLRDVDRVMAALVNQISDIGERFNAMIEDLSDGGT